MANGNHFTPGEPLTGVTSLTTSDIDSATTAINLAATRGIFYISVTAPTSLDTPDWDRMCWLEPIQWNGEDAYQAWTYSASLGDWVKLVAGLPDEDGFDDNSIPVRALKATLLQVGMVPVVTNNGGTPLVQWETFVPTNIPIANLIPGSANSILVTNSGGTGTNWSSLATLLAVLGKVVPLSSITQSGAATNQSIKWDGARWVAYTPYTVTTPDLNEATWAPASNWLEVWSSALTKTVRKTRTNFFNTLLQDYTAGGISFTTEFMGWTDTVTAPARYTIQALYDLISPTIISAAVAAGAALYPKKFYSAQFVGINTGPDYGFATPIAGIAHGLSGTPQKIGFRLIRTNDNGTVASLGTGTWGQLASVPIGQTIDGDVIGFRLTTNPLAAGFCISVVADSAKIYAVLSAAFTNVTGQPYEFALSDEDYSIQLYAYL